MPASFHGDGGAGGIEFSVALEYNGPPLSYDLPRAVPINVQRIPVAAVLASQVSLSDKLSFPVVQPILVAAPDNFKSMQFSYKEEVCLASESTVSPTSVIAAFEQCGKEGDVCVSSKESTSGSEPTVSPTSVIAFKERGNDSVDFIFSGEICSSGILECSELSDDAAVSISRTLESFSNSGELSHDLLGANESCGTHDFCDSLDKSRELSVSSSALRASKDYNDLNPGEWASTESVLSLEYPSSRVSSLRAGDCNNDVSHSDAQRAPLVTFCDIDSDDSFDEDINQTEPAIFQRKKPETKPPRKGACYRCFKGNRFTEKEVCIVCDSKYCSNCVLRAMGSMPEGRKCVTCIGYPVDESKRGNLGKCSRLLKRLLNILEVKQIMKAEKLCEVNQLQPEYVRVNGKSLSPEELIILQNCPNPPKKIKPGSYWYDKVSGLWGKDGQKPSKIITPHLSVGGPVKPNASNGNTQVFINGREITKVELRMLQLAGVQCVGNPHFWVHEDGSYQEEGQKNTKGFIWGKAGTKLVCAILSLPVPSKPTIPCGEQPSNSMNRSFPNYFEQRALQKLLLVGFSGAGTSTIFKQAKILYKDVPFSHDERESIKFKIQSNVYGYLGMLLESREQFDDESLSKWKNNQFSAESAALENIDEKDGKTIYSIGPRLKAFSDWLLKTMVSGNLEAIFPAATREYGPLVEELWKDPAIQATYNRRSELELLPSIANYFLEQAGDILRLDYEPSDVDILYAEGVTSSNGLAFVDFSFPESSSVDNADPANQHDSLLSYQLIKVNAKGLGENCKWLEMFEDVGIIMFCVSLNDFDQFSVDVNGTSTNKLLLSRRFFENIISHPTFEQTDFLLLLNKVDLFEEKIEQVPLNKCEWFNDFHPVISRQRNGNTNSVNNSPTLGQLAFHYIAVKFKRLYYSLTGRKLYVSMVKGLEPNSVDEALKYAGEIVKWGEERTNFGLSEYSVYSTDGNSISS